VRTLPIPHPHTHLTLEDESEHEAAIEVPSEEQDDATFETSTSSCESHLLTQGELNDLVRDLKLSKKQAERLGSTLSFFCNRQEEFQDFYSEENRNQKSKKEFLWVPK